ncbi:MAG: DNA-3-methyladenine glycosylase 2 family protein, partial [Solirubrobacteraceae bacterium]|nr:DNA-3-methyladenine glycosylase 2 family protein [Solirubrobacteraceae bacterium]
MRAIVGQQLSVTAARAIYARLLDHFGGTAPTPRQILEADPEEMRAAAGLSRAKVA